MEDNKALENEILNETEHAPEANEADNPSITVSLEDYERKEKEAADNLDKFKRTLAEFDNFRKRTMKEKASMYDDGVRDTVEKILPIIDNFERALSSAQSKDDGFYKGVEMILRQFEGILDYIGVEKIEAIGSSFNPNLHNAVAHIEDGSYSENEIIEELQKGYIYKEKVLRHSVVKVAN